MDAVDVVDVVDVIVIVDISIDTVGDVVVVGVVANVFSTQLLGSGCEGLPLLWSLVHRNPRHGRALDNDGNCDKK